MEDLPQIEDPESLIQILRHGDYLRHSKQDIVSLLSSDKSDTEKAEYVRSAYPPLLFAEFYKQGTEDHLGYRAAEDGLLLYEGKFTTRKAEVLMEWPFVAQLIGALIKDRNYLDEPRGGEQLSLLDVDTESGQTKEEIVPDTSSWLSIRSSFAIRTPRSAPPFWRNPMGSAVRAVAESTPLMMERGWLCTAASSTGRMVFFSNGRRWPSVLTNSSSRESI